MSGGERKKRDKRQGWEEAGAEFYQESYPAAAIEADLQQALQRDPSHIATLLPSKKSRVATTKRIKNEPRATLRRRTSTRSRAATSTVRRLSANITDPINFSMLPDLSENLSNEELTWEEIMQIKSMPVCMAQKIQLKQQLQNATKLRLQGFEQLKWQRRKFFQQLQEKIKEIYSKIELWNNSFKKIGGNFGMGIVSYFLFIKWLMFLNIIIFLLIFLIIVLPTILLIPDKDYCNINDNNNNTTKTTIISCCSEKYWNRSADNDNIIIDLFKGNGLLERTLLFYGYYQNKIYHNIDNDNNTTIIKTSYDLPLAYIICTILFFLIILLAIVRSAAKGFRERVIEGEGQFYQYCNLIFGGWDYCINNEEASCIKHKAIFNEIKGFLEAERLDEERQNRTREEKIKLLLIRIIINLFVLVVLILCGIFIYFIINISFEKVNDSYNNNNFNNYSLINNNTNNDNINYFSIKKIIQIGYEFLPYICIVGLNVIVPFLFRNLVNFENYKPHNVVRFTLFRIIFLRLASLIVLLTSFYKIIAIKVDDNQCTNYNLNRPLCWETFVGKQFLKLYITDLLTQFLITFFINFPRSLLARHTNNKIIKFIGQQKFDLSNHVLDIIYSQTICWLGTFFVPFLPLIAVIGCFFLFYIKKFACLVNSTPSNQVYRANRSTSLFMFVLLLSFLLAIIPIGYTIAEIKPSKSCGPFRNLDSVWTLIIQTFTKFPNWIQNILFFIGTAGFGIPAFIILSLLLYYYYAVSMANKHMVVVLKNQLVLEGHDKQFLLDRLSALIKHQQEQTKYHHEQSIEIGNFN